MQKLTLLIILYYSFLFVNIFPESKDQDGNKNVNGFPAAAYLNLNNISTLFFNNGFSDTDINDDSSGFRFPRETKKTAIFKSGFLWGVQTSDPIQKLKVGGSAYRTGLQSGRILHDGTAENPELPHVRIYRVRKDVYPGGPFVDLTTEVNDEGKTAEEIRTRYELDWNEWPAQHGAPFIDLNNNNSYDPNVDIPGIEGASQTIWFVANDLDASKTQFLYGTNPIGIEYQATFWNYADEEKLKNVFFRKYQLVNKTETIFDSMFVSMWSDPDVGVSGDDYAGCDTNLSLGYCYNATNIDANYLPLPPPVVGFDLIRGPLVEGNIGEDKNRNGIDDASDFGTDAYNQIVTGKINLPMTAFYYFIRGDSLITDPTQGNPDGTQQFYNFFRGRVGKTGDYFRAPDGSPTKYPLSGDPETGEGWVDGEIHQASDRRIGISSGPFQMMPGDTQTVVFAEIAAGAELGIDRFMAIDSLKKYSEQAQSFYDEKFPTLVEVNDDKLNPNKFILEQNFPNPFNPNTKIKFTLPESVIVNLSVYNILGQKISTLVNKKLNAGDHTAEFDASEFTSGVYIYKIQAGKFSQSMKMLLIK